MAPQTRALSKAQNERNSQSVKLRSILTFTQYEKKAPFYNEFKKFQLTMCTLVSRWPENEIKQQPDEYQKNQEIYFIIKKDIQTRERHLFREIRQQFFDFLCDKFGIIIEEEQDCVIEGFVEKNDLNISQSTHDPRGLSGIDILHSPKQNVQTCLANSNSNLDNSELLYHKKNYSMDICVKRSMKTDKPEIIEQQILNTLNNYQRLSNQIVIQTNMIFRLLRYVILLYYEEQILQVLPDSDDIPFRENLIQKIIQNFLINKSSPLFYILENAVYLYYKDQESKMMNGSTYPQKGSLRESSRIQQSECQENIEPNLDRTLMPRSYKDGTEAFFIANEQSDESSATSIKSQHVIIEENEEEESGSFHNNNFFRQSIPKQQMLQFIKQSEIITTENKIPYRETFPIILRLIKNQKPYKKFKLIQNIDQLIVQIFMRCRSDSQYTQLYDTIMAADSKAEVLFFILYKFSKTYPSCNLEKTLYYPLKFMNDFDGILHSNVKNIFCPYFIRFYSMVEMFVHSDV